MSREAQTPLAQRTYAFATHAGRIHPRDCHLYRYLNGTSAAQIGDGTLVGLALAMIACIVGVVLSTTVFVMVVIGIIGDRD